MSIQAVGWVLDNSASRGLARLVLLSLANHANSADMCWPSQRTIAREAGVAAGTVANMLSQLVTLGEIEVLNAGDNRHSATYRIKRSGCSPGERSAQVGVDSALTPGVDRTVSNLQEQEILLNPIFESDRAATEAAVAPPWVSLGITHREWLEIEQESLR